MPRKTAAVYNPQHPLEKAVQDVYHECRGEWLDASAVSSFIESVIAYEGMYENFLRRPDEFCREVFNSEDHTHHICIPCYTLELRSILRKKTISSSYKIAAFSSRVAKKYLVEYPILLVLDESKINSIKSSDVKGVSVFTDTLDFGGALVRVLTRNRVDSDIAKDIEKITKEEYPSASAYVITDVPGIRFDLSKAAMGAGLRKYIVNITTLNINNEVIKSHNPEAAVGEALDREWGRHNIPHRDPKFTVEYWKNTPYWPMIVKEARVKKAQVQPQQDTPQIQITPKEKQIFDFLLGVNQKYNLGLTFRVAGGWVRDKLLGKDSDDIDIALDKMTGAEFGKYLAKETGRGGNVIKANPDQSKHLETLTITLFGEDIDFANLRSETYGDSRIPVMAMGTPEEDAARRDLTINAIFYNIANGQVEDLTGRGLEDLKTKTLRTPLQPIKTFMDDPIRILRLLRFYSRYPGAKVDPAAVEAMKLPEVQNALKKKVSTERIYKELHKLFVGSEHSPALRLLHDTGLWNLISGEHTKGFHPFTMDQNNPWHVDNVFEHTLKVIEKYDQILRADNAGDDERANALTGAFLHDLGKLDPGIIGDRDGLNTYFGHEAVSAQKANAILQALKASNEDIHYIETIVKNHMLPHNKMGDKQLRRLIRELGKDIVKRIVQHAKADSMSKPGADEEHYDSILNRVQTLEPSGVRNQPVVSANLIMPLFPDLNVASGYLRAIQDHLQDMKDGNPALTHDDLMAEVNRLKPMVEQQFGNFAPVKQRGVKRPPPKLVLPETEEGMQREAATWYDEMRQLGERQNVSAWLCGLVEHDSEKNVVLTANGKGYQLRLSGADVDLSGLIDKKICAKGYLAEGVFTVSGYSEFTNDQPEGIVYVDREEPVEMTDLAVGDKVRHRGRSQSTSQGGLAFPQMEGKVDRIEGNLMYVKWEGIKELEVFKLDDTTALHGVIQKIS